MPTALAVHHDDVQRTFDSVRDDILKLNQCLGKSALLGNDGAASPMTDHAIDRCINFIFLILLIILLYFCFRLKTVLPSFTDFGILEDVLHHRTLQATQTGVDLMAVIFHGVPDQRQSTTI